MQIKSITLAASAAVLSTSVNATMIDTFEDIGANGTTINNRVIDGINVSLGTNTGAVFAAVTYFMEPPFAFAGQPAAVYNNPLTPSNVSGSRFISTAANGAYLNDTLKLVFGFSQDVKEFGFTTIDFEDGSGTLTAYDGNDNVVDSFTVSYPGFNQATSGIDVDWLVSSQQGDISYAVFSTVGIGGGGYGIDDMLVTAVPVPAAIWLFGSGLLGLAGIVKRKTA